MRIILAFIFTVALLAGAYVVSALVYFDLTWLLILVTSVWAGIDSAKIQMSRYRVALASRPFALFGLCALLWIFIFPLYLWTRHRIKTGVAVLKDEKTASGPVKSFFRKMSRAANAMAEWIFIFLISAKILLVFFCLEEYWRGQRVWEKSQQDLQARGDTLDWKSTIPPEVPTGQNFFSAPRMAEWFIKPPGKKLLATEGLSGLLNYSNTTAELLIGEVIVSPPDAPLAASTTSSTLRLNDPNAVQQVKELVQSVAGPCAFGGRGKEVLVIQQWNPHQFKPFKTFLQANTNPSVKDLNALFNNNYSGDGPLTVRRQGTNSFQVVGNFCSASNYLRWTKQFEDDFALMREAVKRPYARMGGDYRLPTTTPAPNFVNFRAVAQTLTQRAQCFLLLGQPEKALQELTLLHNLCHQLEGAPSGKPMSLVAVMINSPVKGLYAATVADGFRLRAWHEPQIVILQSQLAEIDLAPYLIESLRDERRFLWQMLQVSVTSRFEIQRVPNATLAQKLRNLRPPNLLRGFFYLNMVNVSGLEQKAIDSIDPIKGIVLPQRLFEFRQRANSFYHYSPYTFYAAIAVPDYTRAIQHFALNQTKDNEAQIVCALERYRLAHGNYPESLNELVPQFIVKLPHDIIGGQPLNYRRTTDGQFTLYSIGWNEKDDGGQTNPSAYEQGDWVWQ